MGRPGQHAGGEGRQQASAHQRGLAEPAPPTTARGRLGQARDQFGGEPLAAVEQVHVGGLERLDARVRGR